MRLLFKRLRHNGALRPLTDVEADKWRMAEALTDGPRRLVMSVPSAAPGSGVLLELFDPHVVRADHDLLTLRGIERAQVGQVQAAVVQEVMLRLPPHPGGRGIDETITGDIEGSGSTAHMPPGR